jgi:hypothetical protein
MAKDQGLERQLLQ